VVPAAGLRRARGLGAPRGHEPGRRPRPQPAPSGTSDPESGAAASCASVDTLALIEALRTLPVRQRQAIVLHYLADLPVQEVAQVLAVPSGTVKSLLARGRRALAAKLGESEEVLYPS
jgi:DNA-directed RNA polymerase specialized sigma24 family protein